MDNQLFEAKMELFMKGESIEADGLTTWSSKYL